MAVAQGSSFLALCFNLLVNPIALDSIAWRYYFVYVGILVGVCLVVWVWYPETRGRSLEEMAVVFDGEGAVVEVFEKERGGLSVEQLSDVEKEVG